jgi:hypothetical protein
MRGLRWNWPAWAGLLLSILAFISYFRVFARFQLMQQSWKRFIWRADPISLTRSRLPCKQLCQIWDHPTSRQR